MANIIQSWRWYGPEDPVTLTDIMQAGASGIVTALHQVPHGEVWDKLNIQRRKEFIENAGLKWVVAESLPVHEEIKTGGSERERYLENYRISLKNLAAEGITTICYNFMPVLDWTRTDLKFAMPNGALALRFDWSDLAAFDLFLLQRTDARNEYPGAVIEKAEKKFEGAGVDYLRELEEIILMGVPTEQSATIPELRRSIETYKKIGRDGLRQNLVYFLQSIADVCQESGIRMTIHPDDPPYPILGLPRVASNKDDLQYILETVNSDFNGLCFCTGSLGAGAQNDVVDILDSLIDRVYFLHLRNVKKEKDGSFYESDHLDGDVDMPAVMQLLVRKGKSSRSLPMRPDHGHQMLDDLKKICNPGYSAIGRLKGLAELRGLEMGIRTVV